ncbi:transaldolase [Halioxenophilus sp. WMMB6]|uniref:transaldolase n=1 Tax=Halioxenophilus sp. WMMB6 TaxID=3073815 RepID=UPI00295E6F95|nr:transaldolase [Halioxenophilus sp. WMMB6]
MSTKLAQLKEITDVVADTGDIQAIAKYRPLDATTNPSLLLKAAQLPQYQPLIEESVAWAKANASSSDKIVALATTKLAVAIGCEILKFVPGKVSTEVDARFSFDTAKTLIKARQIIALYEAEDITRERVLIKIAATWEGIRAAEILEAEGIRCNLTLLFSFCQAVACAEAGVFLISPFVGRILDWHKAKQPDADFTGSKDPGVVSVTAIYNYYKSHGYETIVMGASFRNTGEIEALAGCDRLTISPQLLEELESDTSTLSQMLSPETASSKLEKLSLSEAEFRLMLNDDAMATEKLAEGIRNFIADQVKLEEQLKPLCQ